MKITGNKDVAVDTSALVGLVDARDNWHSKMKNIWSKLEGSDLAPIYFDCVMNETISILARRTEEQRRSEEFLATLKNLRHQVPDDAITWVSQEIQRLYSNIIDLVLQTDGKLNFHDALIALCCKELGIELILSFDKDFGDIEWLTRVGDESDIPVLDKETT